MTKLASALSLLALLAVARPAAASELDLRAPGLDAPVADQLRLKHELQLGSAGEVGSVKQTTIFGLPRNVGPVDRVVRVALAATLVGVGAYRLSNDSPNKGLSWALVGVAAVPAATAATGYCPLYQLLGIDNTF